MDYQRIAVKFLHGGWKMFSIPNKTLPNGDRLVHLNLDSMFADRSTSIRFKGYGKLHGRALYIETHQPRQFKQVSNNTIDFYASQEVQY